MYTVHQEYVVSHQFLGMTTSITSNSDLSRCPCSIPEGSELRSFLSYLIYPAP